MDNISQNQNVCASQPFEISDDDILEAMKGIEGYLDITPGDFKALYRLAYNHAMERLAHSIKARNVMKDRVIFVERGTPSEEVAFRMATHDISGVPVVEKDKKVVGIISEKDFMFRMGQNDTTSFMGVVAQCLRNKGCVAISIRQQKAEEIMTSPAITVRENTPVSEIANIFTEKSINRVPVIDQDNKLIGIVARADIVQSSCYPDIKRRNDN